jgi:hypothetical protein
MQLGVLSFASYHFASFIVIIIEDFDCFLACAMRPNTAMHLTSPLGKFFPP